MAVTVSSREQVVVREYSAVDYDKETTSAGGPCQLNVKLEGTMSFGGKRRGKLTINPGWLRDHGLHLVTCDDCNGSGKVGEEDCSTCLGRGKVANPQKAYENLVAQFADRAQSELDKLNAWIEVNAAEDEVCSLFE